MVTDSKKLASAREVFSLYWSYAQRYPIHLFFILAGGLGLQAAALAAPLFLRTFFNTLAANNPTAEVVAQLTGVLLLLLLMYLGEWVARRIQNWANLLMSARVMSDLLSESFEYLIRHSYNFFISRFSGSLTHRVNKFAKAYETLFDTIVISFIPTFLFVGGAVVILSIRSPILGVMLGTWIVLFIVFQIYIAIRRQPLRVARSEADTAVTATLADSVSNQSTIQLFSGASFEQGLFKKAVMHWRAMTLRTWGSDELTWASIGLFVVAIEIGLLYGALVFWSRGLLTIGDFVLIQAYLLTTFERLVGINRELRRFYDAFADASEMTNILQTPHEISDKRSAKKLKVQKGAVWFDDITFRFHDQNEVLEHFNLTIAGGERVAFVGPSGAGKSTITKLLLRFFDVQKGSISIDGQTITSVTQESLRDSISFVPQEPILFHRTLMENIRYGRRDATDKEVMEAARQAHCHEFISKLPEGYDTYVGERGVKLSGGERQRVAIARAILKNAPILVLDEATSSLDSESEALIQDALETLMQGKTAIVIAHRLSTVMKMDRIAVIENGAIVAQGTHLELANQEGLYRKLWSIQAGGFLGSDEEPVSKNPGKKRRKVDRDEEEFMESARDDGEDLAVDEKPL